MTDDELPTLPPWDIHNDGERLMLVIPPGRYRIPGTDSVLTVADPGEPDELD